MNILVLSWRDPKHPLAGGAEQVMHEHMKGWIASGHSVTFFSSRFPGSKEQEDLDGVKIIRWGNDLFLGVQISAATWYLFGSHKKFDLVVDEFHGFPFFTPIYVKAPKLAVIQEVAREVWFFNPLAWPFNWIIGAVGYLIEPWIIKSYKNIPFMTGSESAKQDLVGLGVSPHKITIVPHGVLVNKPKNMSQKSPVTNHSSPKTIAFLGALARDKGVEDAIKTFGILSERGKFNFWIVGKGEESYVRNLKKKCRELKIYENTKFWGFVDQKKKFELLSRAHVLINPSIREGWGLVNIEANSVGTPVVAYSSPGLVDSVKNDKSGLLCNVNVPAEMAAKVEDLLSDSKKYGKMRKTALAWSKQFSWESSRKKSLRLIEEVVSS